MAKIPANPSEQSVDQTQSANAAAAKEDPKEIDLNKPAIKQAIVQGQALIKEGKSKADATRSMYPLLCDESKEVIIASFVEGAGLTPKGAQTYYYNCKRKMAKAAKEKNRQG